MNKVAIILAGGKGLRAGGKLPKQLHLLCGLPVLVWSIRAFLKADHNTKIVIVANPLYKTEIIKILQSEQLQNDFQFTIAGGGESRCESVYNALLLLGDKEDCLIAVHDAARPLVDAEMIRRGWNVALHCGSAVPVVPATDSLRRIKDDSSAAVTRTEYRIVQTPQVFDGIRLRQAYDSFFLTDKSLHLATDDAYVWEQCFESVTLYEGSPDNFKITNPKDFAIAAALLKYSDEK